MAIKLDVNWKIKVNGKEYGSVAEMPGAIREAYEKAVGNSPDPAHTYNLAVTTTRIVFNGREYASLDSMPADIRRTYASVMAMAKAVEASPGDNAAAEVAGSPALPPAGGPAASSPGPQPIAPEAFSTRKLVAAAGILALLGAIYFLLRG